MKQVSKYKKVIYGGFFVGGLLLTSCTSHFENWNINPNEVTPEQLERDNLKTGAYFTQMERGIMVVGEEKGGLFEETQMLTGDILPVMRLLLRLGTMPEVKITTPTSSIPSGTTRHSITPILR